ncbi:MAG: type II secretion system GspH family protein [Planctomycetes bacterium]|nr:type II secretion system GspH family protein [Planctomycetota bacterium]
MRNVKRSGFTLIEVIVALAIAGGALVLLLSANQASLRKSVHATQEAAVLRAAETAFDAYRCGDSDATEGGLKGMPGWTWKIRASRAEVGSVENLQRLTFDVYSPDAPQEPFGTYEALRYRPPEPEP